jgi:hypothetical protein
MVRTKKRQGGGVYRRRELLKVYTLKVGKSLKRQQLKISLFVFFSRVSGFKSFPALHSTWEQGLKSGGRSEREREHHSVYSGHPDMF